MFLYVTYLLEIFYGFAVENRLAEGLSNICYTVMQKIK